MTKPLSESCLRNQAPILAYLSPYLQGGDAVLELGSGTGQHAVYFGSRLSGVRWQASDVSEQLSGIHAWVDELNDPSVPSPILLDVNDPLPSEFPSYQCVFTANTLHFVSQQTGESLIRRASEVLAPMGYFIVYGPFNDQGRFTSEGNMQLDRWLKSRDPSSGIRDLQWLIAVAQSLGLSLLDCHTLPANNLLVVFHQLADGEIS